MTKQQLWDMANNADTLAKVNEAEKEIRNANIDNETFDDLMMTISWKCREIYHRG